jgi:hypothetical protein
MQFPRHRFTVRRLMVAVALSGIACSITAWLLNGPSTIDMIVSVLAGHDTAYSAGYNELGWRALRRGMTQAEVEPKLGTPLKKTILYGQREIWTYSTSPDDGNYWMRQIHFLGGKIEKIDSRFYVD